MCEAIGVCAFLSIAALSMCSYYMLDRWLEHREIMAGKRVPVYAVGNEPKDKEEKS